MTKWLFFQWLGFACLPFGFTGRAGGHNEEWRKGWWGEAPYMGRYQEDADNFKGHSRNSKSCLDFIFYLQRGGGGCWIWRSELQLPKKLIWPSCNALFFLLAIANKCVFSFFKLLQDIWSLRVGKSCHFSETFTTAQNCFQILRSSILQDLR